MANVKFQTSIQGSDVQKIIDNLEKNSPTDDDIDNEKPMYFDAVIDEDKRVIFKIDMLTEKDYYNFLKNYNSIQTTITRVIDKVEGEIDSAVSEGEEITEKEIEAVKETSWGFIDQNKEIKGTFSDMLTAFSECVNPETLIRQGVCNILNINYQDGIQRSDFIDLYYELESIEHSCLEDKVTYHETYGNKFLHRLKLTRLLKKVEKSFCKGKITYGDYKKSSDMLKYNINCTYDFDYFVDNVILDFFSKMSLKFLKKLARDVLLNRVRNFFMRIPIYKLLPVFPSILKYNTYHVKKKLQTIQKKVMNHTNQQGVSTYLLGKSLVTVVNGDTLSPELRFSER